MDELKKEFKLDTSFDLLKTDGINLKDLSIASDYEEDLSKNTDENSENIKKDKIKDMKSIFATANDSVKKATEIFNKNIELKKKLEEKIELFNKEKTEFENKTQEFRNHKEGLAKQVELFKQKQSEFEMYRISEKKKFEAKVKEIEKRSLELKTLEESLKTEKIIIENERNKCEEEKQELANNLNKFNQLVGEFSSGMDQFNKVDDLGNI